MVDKEYAKSFTDFSQVFSSSKMVELEKNPLYSMAKFGDLPNLPKGEQHFYYEGGKPVGKKQIPDDIYNLLSVSGLNIQVWYSGDDSSIGTHRESAFEIRLCNDDIPLIIIYYGLVSGVQEILVCDFNTYKCSIPAGFTLADFANILNKNKLKDFVLANCSLSEPQRLHIIEHGLC